ncbi:MAG TPA: hypothetical protein PKD38_11380 [Nitrospira sp.]|nr:hypothetical protein [Nitrospira sp.]
MANVKKALSWIDVKGKLADFDRAGLIGLVQDLSATKDNKAFLHARFGLGDDPLEPYKDVIIRWINPPDFRNPISVSKAKKTISDYKKALGQPGGWPNSQYSTVRKCSTFWPAVAWMTKAIMTRWCGCSSKR